MIKVSMPLVMHKCHDSSSQNLHMHCAQLILQYGCSQFTWHLELGNDEHCVSIHTRKALVEKIPFLADLLLAA